MGNVSRTGNCEKLPCHACRQSSYLGNSKRWNSLQAFFKQCYLLSLLFFSHGPSAVSQFEASENSPDINLFSLRHLYQIKFVSYLNFLPESVSLKLLTKTLGGLVLNVEIKIITKELLFNQTPVPESI